MSSGSNLKRQIRNWQLHPPEFRLPNALHGRACRPAQKILANLGRLQSVERIATVQEVLLRHLATIT